jgi:hypothetical protein
MAVGDSFLALTAFTLTEAYFLHRTLITHETFRAVLRQPAASSAKGSGQYYSWREHYQKTSRIATNKCFVGLLEQCQVL